MTRVVVVGHTEWVEFVRVPRAPAPGTIVEGERLFEHAGGGAVVAAAVLRELGAEVDFYTAVVDDERGRRALGELRSRGVRVHAAMRSGDTRSVFTAVPEAGERLIVTVGERHAPARSDRDLDLGPLHAADGVYATAADAGLLAEAGRCPALVITPRVGAPDALAGDAPVGEDAGATASVRAMVYSASDPDETRDLSRWTAIAQLLVATEGADGGHWREGDGRPRERGRWDPAPVPGPPRDSYGCGDAFAAGFTFGLARGDDVARAAAVGARCGAAMLARVGAP